MCACDSTYKQFAARAPFVCRIFQEQWTKSRTAPNTLSWARSMEDSHHENQEIIMMKTYLRARFLLNMFIKIRRYAMPYPESHARCTHRLDGRGRERDEFRPWRDFRLFDFVLPIATCFASLASACAAATKRLVRSHFPFGCTDIEDDDDDVWRWWFYGIFKTVAIRSWKLVTLCISYRSVYVHCVDCACKL